ncbi:PAS domain-containing protein [Aestuariispira insulae]|uniref:PAS domain-containing protein n=1 Tax=Aestuariispira insulae TaxID=1461337 RepID=A0A3D9HRR5_9PROT|nr:PAS domain-containing protein [Aestuariispira insulae]
MQADPCKSRDCHPVCLEFFNYWNGLRDDSLVPSRRSFLPEEIPQLLGSFILVELISDDEILTRLAGSQVVENFGFDPKGVNYLDFVDQSRRHLASMNIWTTHRQPCGVWALTEQHYPEGKAVRSEMLGLPLDGDGISGPLVLFLRHAVSKPQFLHKKPGHQPTNNILDLKFIDIGAGVPAGPLPTPE